MGGYFLPPPYQEDNMENLLQQRAQIQARGAQQSGQIWGNAFQNVGQIAGQAVQQYGEQRDQKKIQGAGSAGLTRLGRLAVLAAFVARDRRLVALTTGGAFRRASSSE